MGKKWKHSQFLIFCSFDKLSSLSKKREKEKLTYVAKEQKCAINYFKDKLSKYLNY